MSPMLRAPFPWFGGKGAVVNTVWSRLGDVGHYVEPFFGSGAMLLGRPSWHKGSIETINDADHFVANFWRAVQSDPVAVARHADWPVNETDLHARHYWLITAGRDRIAPLMMDPDRYDAEVAGWWVWGLCAWIGGGWCSGKGAWSPGADGWAKKDSGWGISRQRPHLGHAGQGINRQLPHLGSAGRGEFIAQWMNRLAARLRNVRVCAGDWSRVVTPAVLFPLGDSSVTGVFLDPPYADTAGRTKDLYSSDCLQVAHDVRRWAIENGDNPRLRIVLAGYEGEHEMPGDWGVIEWKTDGGYGNQSDDDDNVGRANARKERLWFSPHCLRVARQASLLDLMEADHAR